MSVVYCYRSGQIRIGDRAPRGAIPFARGRKAALTKLVRATARLAYDGKTFLVPGLPESRDDRAVDVLIEYADRLRLHPSGCKVLGRRK